MKMNVKRLSQWGLLLVLISSLAGCGLWEKMTVRSQSPEEKNVGSQEKPRLVGDLARPFGLHPLRVEGVAIVSDLDNTGSDPPPNMFRQMLFRDLKKRGVAEPTRFISSRQTSLVLVRARIPAGAQKGDRLDVEVQTPSNSDTTSLHGGWLMETDLREMAYLDNSFKSGHLMAVATGPVMVAPRKADKNVQQENKREQLAQCKGVVLGGGVSQKTRNLGLVLPADNERKMAIMAETIAKAINNRFHIYSNGMTLGMAKAKGPRYIELAVHPRYKDNVQRYMAIVRSVAIIDAEAVRIKRLGELKIRLLDPITSMYAALELEAIGKQEAIDVLREGIKSTNTEVRYYSAEALAFLDQTDCTDILKQIARDEPAFRVFALGALAALDDINSYDALVELMQSTSTETRYGAFRALWYMRPLDPLAMGTSMGKDGFTVHCVESPEPNLVHLSKSKRPEIVLFGKDLKMTTPMLLDAGRDIMIKSEGGNKVEVIKFSINEPTQKRTITADLAEIIKTVADLGATYPDVVEMLQKARTDGTLSIKVQVDAVPLAGRTYRRPIGANSDKSASEEIAQEDQDSVSEEDKELAGDDSLESVEPEKLSSNEEESEIESRNKDLRKRESAGTAKRPWYRFW